MLREKDPWIAIDLRKKNRRWGIIVGRREKISEHASSQPSISSAVDLIWKRDQRPRFNRDWVITFLIVGIKISDKE
jgi:hypothetical protein